MLVGSRVCVAQVLGIHDELFTKPCTRHGQIGAVVIDQVGSVPVCRVIHPIPLRFGRVVGKEHGELFAATHNGLPHTADFLRVLKLIQLLKPQVLDIAFGDLDGLGLFDLISAPEQDDLPGGDVCEPQRAHRFLPQVSHAQLVDRP